MQIHAKQLVFFSVSIKKPVDLEVKAAHSKDWNAISIQ